MKPSHYSWIGTLTIESRKCNNFNPDRIFSKDWGNSLRFFESLRLCGNAPELTQRRNDSKLQRIPSALDRSDRGADHFAGDNQFDAAVLLSARGSVIGSHRDGETLARRCD